MRCSAGAPGSWCLVDSGDKEVSSGFDGVDGLVDRSGDENGGLRYIRAIQGHSSGMSMSPRLMNYVMIPYKWKHSMAEAGLVAGGRERKEGRQTTFFTPLDPFNSEADEAESITDTTKPRKVQYQNSMET